MENLHRRDKIRWGAPPTPSSMTWWGENRDGHVTYLKKTIPKTVYYRLKSTVDLTQLPMGLSTILVLKTHPDTSQRPFLTVNSVI